MGAPHQVRTAPDVQRTRGKQESARTHKAGPTVSWPQVENLDISSLLSLQATVGNRAVGLLLQRAAPPAVASPPPPTAAAKTAAEVLSQLQAALAERYQHMFEMTAQVAPAASETAADFGPPTPAMQPVSKHNVIGGPAELEERWGAIEKQILHPRKGPTRFATLHFLFEDEAVHDLGLLTIADRQKVAAGFRQVLIGYATDDQLTGTAADVDVIIKQITDSFHETYLAASGADKHSAIPAEHPALYVKQHWPSIDYQIHHPSQRPKKSDSLLHILFVGMVPEQIRLLSRESRDDVSKRVFDALVRYATDDKQTAATIDAEWARLSHRLRVFIEGEKAGYLSVREALLNTFGALEDANAYYASMVPAGFGSNGNDQVVHPRLAARLAIAATKLNELDPSHTLQAGASIGGVNVRENRNNVSQLSKHSYGCAIDVNESMNPNIPANIARELYPLIKTLTGQDIQANAAGRKPGPNFTRGLTTAQVLPEAERLKATSDALKASFTNEAGLSEGMGAYAHGYALQAHFALPGTASGNELLAATKLVVKKKKKLSELGRSIFNEQGPVLEGLKRPTAADQKAVAQVLVIMYQRFLEGQGSEPEAIAKSVGQVTRFGFLNLDPRLVAALAGSDGGALTWLGAETRGVKDFMHFELPEKMPPPEATRRASAAPVQRASVDAGVKTDADAADAGVATAGAGLKRVGGDESSKKLMFISWTFDDGPSAVTEAMEKAAPVPATWFIMRDLIGSGEHAKRVLFGLKKKQDAGQEFGVHGVHLTENHITWFPGTVGGHYDDIREAMSDLTVFVGQLREAELRIRYVRVPTGLASELQGYLGLLGVASGYADHQTRADRIRAIADAIIKDRPIPKDPKAAAAAGAATGRDAGMAGAAAGTGTAGAAGLAAGSEAAVRRAEAAAIDKVQSDYRFMRQKLDALGLSEIDWEAESEPPEVAQPKDKTKKATATQILTDDAVDRFKGEVDVTVKDGGPHSFVFLAHDTKVSKTETGEQGFKRSDKVAQDMLAMEAYAKARGVRIEYYTLSDLATRKKKDR